MAQNRLVASIMGITLFAVVPGMANPASTAVGPKSGQEAVGSIKTMKGEVFLLRAGQKIPAGLGTSLLLQDEVHTGLDGSVGMILRDDTALSMGPSSELALKSFVFQPKDGLFSSVIAMAKGTLVYISGKISKLAPGSVKVETPVGTAVVRGTKLLVQANR